MDPLSPLPSEKPEFPPLLQIGRHNFTIDQLEELTVGRFPLSTSRLIIMKGFRCVYDLLIQNQMVGELWIDGSFLTEKIDPSDIDVLYRTNSIFLDNSTPTQREVIEYFHTDLKSAIQCHIFYFIEYPSDHPAYWDGEYSYVYWMKQWGFSRKDEPKGIAIIKLWEG